jgi:hypothetical protein
MFDFGVGPEVDWPTADGDDFRRGNFALGDVLSKSLVADTQPLCRVSSGVFHSLAVSILGRHVVKKIRVVIARNEESKANT